MQLVYEIILLNKILRNHLLSKTPQWNYCFALCYPSLPHARSQNFVWHLLWLSTNKGRITVKLLAVSQTRQFQLFSTALPSNFWKIAQFISKINTVSLRFISLSFPNKKSSSERTCPYWQWIVCTIDEGNDRYQWSGGKTFTPCAARTIIFQRENLKYLVCFT